MSSIARQQMDNWLKTLDIECDTVLDIGGSQVQMPDRVNSWRVNEYKILDLQTPHHERVKPDIIWDINENIKWIDGIISVKYQEYFDKVFMLEVLDYIWDPVTALRNCNEFLKRGGKVYLSFHFIYPFHGPYEVDYLRLTPNCMTRILEETGFQDIEFIPRTFSKEAFRHYIDMVLTDGMRRYFDSDITGGMMIATKS
jgi:SAM-dependent methyltransferase